jgi:hypothetical protein
VKAEPKNGELRDRFASALSRQKRLDEAEAEAEYGEVIRLRPKFAGGSERLGVILKWRGSLAEASRTTKPDAISRERSRRPGRPGKLASDRSRHPDDPMAADLERRFAPTPTLKPRKISNLNIAPSDRERSSRVLALLVEEC